MYIFNNNIMPPITFKLSTLNVIVQTDQPLLNTYVLPNLISYVTFKTTVSTELLNQSFLIKKANRDAKPDSIKTWEVALRLFQKKPESLASSSVANNLHVLPVIPSFIFKDSLPTTDPTNSWKEGFHYSAYLVDLEEDPFPGYTKTCGTDYLTFYCFQTLGDSATIGLNSIIVDVNNYITNLENKIQETLDEALEAESNRWIQWDGLTHNHTFLFELLQQIEKLDYARYNSHFVEAEKIPSGLLNHIDSNATQEIDNSTAYKFLFRPNDKIQFLTNLIDETTVYKRSIIFEMLLV